MMLRRSPDQLGIMWLFQLQEEMDQAVGFRLRRESEKGIYPKERKIRLRSLVEIGSIGDIKSIVWKKGRKRHLH